MSELYSVRVAARPDDRTLDLDIKVVHPDSMHVPVSAGFALMLLHDTVDADSPLGREVDLNTVMNGDWAQANAKAFVESVELLSSKNEPPEAALDDYEHSYWKSPKRWLEARLRIRATHPAWISHVPSAWDSASFSPTLDYDDSPPAVPGATPEIVIEREFESSTGFLPIPRLLIASDAAGCDEVIWIPAYGVRAYEPVERVAGLDVSFGVLAGLLGEPVMWQIEGDDDVNVGVITAFEGSYAKLVTISAGSRSTCRATPEQIAWVARAAFRRGTPRLPAPLSLEPLLRYASPAALVREVDGCEATIEVFSVELDSDREPRLDNLAEILRLIAIPAYGLSGGLDGATSKLGAALRHERDTRDLGWDTQVYPVAGGGVIASYSLLAPRERRETFLDGLERAELLEFIRERRWPTWTVRVVATDPAWLEHLDEAGPWSVDQDSLESDEWDEDQPLTWDPERFATPEGDDDDDDDDHDPSAGKSALRREFELDGPVVTAGPSLAADDPRAVLRDHGLCEDVNHSEAHDNFEAVCKAGNVAAVRAYITLGIDIERPTSISFETPLIRATEGDQPEVVRTLAAAGVNLQGRDGGGDTAVMTAINWDHPTVLRTLLELGADPNVPDNYENYPLVKALEKDEAPLIEALLDANASVNAGAATRDSALQWCMRERNEERLRSLLEQAGADINQATANGDTLLHLAVLAEDQALVELLLDAGAANDRANRWGWTPHDVAQALDAEDIAERLTTANAPAPMAATLGLFRAAAAGDIDAVADAIASGVSVDSRNHHGRTALMIALGEEQPDLAAWLLAHGADVNARDDDSNALSFADTPEDNRLLIEAGIELSFRDREGKLRQPGLEAALDQDDPDLLDLVLARGPDLSDLSASYSTMIWGDFEDRLDQRAETLRKLAAAGANLDSGDPSDGGSLLIGHINRGHEAPALALIEVGVDLERADKNHVTPLIKSCSEYSEHEIQARITRALLARGADYTKTEWLARSAYDAASSVDNDECIAALEEVFEQTLHDALVECGRDDDEDPEDFDAPVFEALVRRSNFETFRHWIRKGQHAIVRGLLAAGFDPNPPQIGAHGLRPGDLPLVIAVSAGDDTMVEVLLDGGADPNLIQVYGSTALSYAVSERRAAVVERLLAAGANPAPLDDSWQTPMNSAAAHGELELLERLVTAGASVNPVPAGRLPLHSAVRSGQFEAAQWLVTHGANLNARAEGRRTALHEAIEKDETELALALLAAGADPNVQTSDDEQITPLIQATKKGNLELIAALLRLGVDTSIADADGQTAIDHASYRAELRALFPDAGVAPTFERVERVLPPLLRAIHRGDRLGFAAALASDGLEVRNYRGDTALMLAVSLGLTDVVEALLEAGADVHASNDKGDSAWSYAFSGGQEPLRVRLEAAGVKTSMDGLNQMAGQSMRRDANVAAIEAGDIARVAKLIGEHELDVDWLGRRTRPLELAIDRADTTLIQLLLANGADPSLPATSGETLAEYAERAGHGALFER